MIRSLHILGSIMFLGGMMATIGWVALANRTKKPEVLSFATKTTTIIDMSFTNIGVVLLMPTGFLLANNMGGIFAANWIIASLGLISISGLVYFAFCLRYQLKMAKIAKASVEAGKDLSDEFYGILNKWFLSGAIATITPLIALFLMILKPTL